MNAVAARPQSQSEPAMRHRLEVIGWSVRDVIESAGSWLADRAMAGWQVDVYVPAGEDVRPLRVLGVDGYALDAADRILAGTAIAVSGKIFDADAELRRWLLDRFGRDLPEVTLWGDTQRTEFDGRLHVAEHVASRAASAFKKHALAAAGVGAASEASGASEQFRTGSADRPRLVAVGARLPAVAVWAQPSAVS